MAEFGCGTGALTEAILQRGQPARVAAIDASVHDVGDARARLTAAQARLAVARAQHLPFADGGVGVVVSGLVLNFVPTPADAVAEMTRVARPGGVVAVYVWDYAGAMQLIRFFWDAAVALDPQAATLDEGKRFGLCHPDRFASLFRGAGLLNVATRAIDVPTRFSSFNDFWSPFLGGQGPAPGYVMGLPDDARERLRNRLHRTIPIAPDGSIALTARAWAVRGERSRLDTPTSDR